ncbi:MAG: nucleotidyltransferase [Rickettsiales bacterium]
MLTKTIIKKEPSLSSRKNKITEEFLEDVATAIQIPDGRYEEAVSRYKSLKDWLLRDDSILKNYKPEVSLQGSFKLGTAIKPVSEEEEYDIDLVCSTEISKSQITQKRLKEMMGKEIAGYAKSYNMQNPESKRRCWRVQYSQDAQFHLDALPAIPDSESQRTLLESLRVESALINSAIAITDDEHPQYNNISQDWLSSNPEGYSNWFYGRMKAVFNSRRSVIALSEGRREEEIPNYKVKTPLQSAIQILKRHRDMTHDEGDEDKPISIIITTLAARAYNQEITILESLNTILFGMENYIENRNGIYWITNPTNPQENFADKWAEDSTKKEKFFEWLENAKNDFSELWELTDRREIAESSANFLGRQLVERAINEKSKTNKPNFLIRLLNPPHRKKLEWPENITKKVIVTAEVIRNGFRKQPIKSDEPAIPKYCDLFFTATTNVAEPYEIYWQVVNTGKQAKEFGQLRGGFDFSTANLGKNIRRESTSYKGSHSLECFIIKDGVCVARSGQFVVNIR